MRLGHVCVGNSMGQSKTLSDNVCEPVSSVNEMGENEPSLKHCLTTVLK